MTNLFTCGGHGHHAHGAHAHRAPADQAGGTTVRKDGKSKSIDIHCHCDCPKVAEIMKPEIERQQKPVMQFGSALTKEVNRKQLEYVRTVMDSVDSRLADMDRMGVDIQVISLSPYQYFYWAEPELGRQVAEAANDHLVAVAATHPDRMMAMAHLPMQSTEFAIAELKRCIKEHGTKAIEIGGNVNGEELSNPRFEKLWQFVVENDILVFLHPQQFTEPKRLTEHYFVNIMGHPFETSLALGQLIFGGVLDRYPGLKLVAAHGGGFLPAYSARMDHAYEARADVREGLPNLPTSYLKKLYFDTMVFEPGQLKYLIETYGADHILLGTDWPYDMGEEDPRGLVGKVAGLNDADNALICGGNAARLLGL